MNGIKIANCAIVTATAIALIALSLVLAAPASARHAHGTDGPAKHTATSAGSSHPSRNDSVDDVAKVATNPSAGEPATAAESDTVDPGASEMWLPGHDKCKRRKGLRSLPLWCTDRGAGWISSTTYRTQNDPAITTGIRDASSLPPVSELHGLGPTRAVNTDLYRVSMNYEVGTPFSTREESSHD
jgi:hypothetical protein